MTLPPRRRQVDALQRPLKDMLDPRTHYTVFSNLEQLRELHVK